MKSKSYDELNFTDDFIFCAILTENEDICKELVEMITGRRISAVLYAEDQKSIKKTRDGKGVRLDVYFEDEENIAYDIEMQLTSRNLPKRVRYYQGMMDLDVLDPGDEYDKLKESYIIFICTFDEFEKGRHKYSFENTCVEDPSIKLKDGAHKIFLCAGGEMDDCSEKMKDFLDYVAGKNTTGELTNRLREEVERVKKSDRWRAEYMLLELNYREKYKEGLEDGRKEGLEQGEAERKALEEKNVALEGEIARLKAQLAEASITIEQ